MASSESGDALYKEGESLLRGKKSFFGLGGAKYEEAADKFVEAGRAYRKDRDLQKAGQAFVKAAEVQRKYVEGGTVDAANNESEAFKAFRQASPLEAAEALNRAIDYYRGQNPRRAATHLETLAKFYEEDMDDQAKALEAYDESATIFDDDNAEQLANKAKIKVGELAALQGDYYRACKKFDDVALKATKNNLLRYSAKDYMLKGGICHLATGDVVGSRKALESYVSWDPTFQQQREYLLLNDLIEAVEKGDPEMFSDRLFQFDQVSKLDTWKTAILVKIKGQIESAGEDFS